MSPALVALAGAVARPRGRRPVCDGSRLAMAAGCVHDDHRAHCPVCRVDVATEPYLPRAVVLAVHREVKP